jgi:hypothetical protein
VQDTITHPEQTEGRLDRGNLYGLIAEFEDPHDLVTAAGRAREAGYTRMDAFTPFPVEELSEALGHRDMHVPWIMLAGGILGALGGFALLTWTTTSAYVLNIGGRPLFAWPSFIPITFECTVLLSALSGIAGMFAINGLPMPYHPVFSAPNFDRATSDRFFLCIEVYDKKFDRDETRSFLEGLGAARVSEVELKK